MVTKSAGCCSEAHGGQAEAKRVSGIHPHAPDLPGDVERPVLVAVVLQDLVIAKVEGAFHLQQAPLDPVRRLAPTRLASHEVGDERPLLIARARHVVGHHLLVPVSFILAF